MADNQFIAPKPEKQEEKIEVQDTDDLDLETLDEPKSDFKTPDEVAAQDSHTTAEPILDRKEIEQKMSKKKRIDLSFFKTKKGIAVIVAVVLLLGLGSYFLFFNKHNKSITNINTHTKAPTTVASNLTGLQVNPDTNKLPVTAVMIENSIDARPQSGLSAAGVVFEAIAEGGVTRFMALFQNNDSTSLGPIRSARPYYISWAMGFDAAYVHVGGSPDALADITNWNVKDLNQFYNGSYFQRVSSRPAPHNVYTNLSSLTQLEQSKGFTSSKFTSWTRKKDKPILKPTANTVSFNLSGPIYNPVYTYNAKTNSYNRSENGAPQIDANTNLQISPKVVIGIVVPLSQGALDASGAYYSDYNVIGSGNAYIFQDGHLTKGTWTKNSNSEQILFTDENGKTIPLNAGQTWVTALASDSDVSSS